MKEGFGFEVCAANIRDTRHALQEWRGSEPHNNVILNLDVWRRMKWQALGAVFYNGYACAWFGEDVDE